MKISIVIVTVLTLCTLTVIFLRYGRTKTSGITEIEKESVDTQTKLDIENPLGDVLLTSTDTGELKITIEKSTSITGSKSKLDDVFKKINVEINKKSDSFIIKVVCKDSAVLTHYGADLKLEVPKKITVVTGKSLSTRLSAVKLNEVQELSLATESGNIDISECVVNNFFVRVMAGNISIDKIKGNLTVESNSSKINIDDLEGIVKYTSDSSELSLKNAWLKSSSSFNSNSGPLNIGIRKLDQTGDYVIDSRSGNVEITLPREFEFNLDARYGSIKNDFEITEKEETNVSNRLVGVVGKGGPKLNIFVSEGKISLLKFN